MDMGLWTSAIPSGRVKQHLHAPLATKIVRARLRTCHLSVSLFARIHFVAKWASLCGQRQAPRTHLWALPSATVKESGTTSSQSHLQLARRRANYRILRRLTSIYRRHPKCYGHLRSWHMPLVLHESCEHSELPLLCRSDGLHFGKHYCVTVERCLQSARSCRARQRISCKN